MTCCAVPSDPAAVPRLNAPLTKFVPEMMSRAVRRRRGARLKTAAKGIEMDFDALFAKTPATLDEIKRRVACALQRHPLCRNVRFDIVSMPRSSKGGNWTISLQAVAPDALWEASDIIADIQDAYELTAAA
jgi:hypothetical protein